jgi:hypothetical protein
MTEEALFLAALDRPPAERAAFLDGACAGDPDLRKRLDVLLAAFAAGKGKLEPPPVDPDSTAHYTPKADAGTVIAGRYKLLERIGEGGMGEVWMAEQVQPVQRRVAVKLIKPGMDSKAVLARFEAERQALAMMDHPNIARVFDGGTTQGEPGGVSPGRPFFVMELVKGVPITEYCDARKLGPRERLELFVPVCLAVQHAHQKGVIHRDLKPSNVLVAPYDGRPVPKVIDFGIAKAAGARLTDLTLHTAFGAVIGTPQYMAPEQAELNNLDIDTRADVYSLGVLLYELLAGSPPFEAKALAEAGLLEAFRVIREQEPPKPSTKASTSAALPTIAANRGLEPSKLTGLLRGELDWIVMKALEKDRARRYETANGFAADVQRYLAGEPVLAVPPSAGYRFRKFVRKHKARVTVAAGMLTLLVGGLVATSYGFYRADIERQIAEGAQESATDYALAADAERTKAEAQTASVAVDLDLKFFETGDFATGMLRLARRMKLLPADAVELRQFVLMTVFAQGQQTARLVPGPRLSTGALSPDGRTLIRADDAGISLCDLPTGEKLVRLWPRADPSGFFEFSTDGRAVWMSDLSTVRVWDSPSGRRRCEVRPGGDKLHDVYMSPDGSRFVTVSEPGRWFDDGPPKHTLVELWDAAGGRLVARLDHGGSLIADCRFSPGGRFLLTASGKVARAWSAADGRLLQTLGGHAGEVLAVAVSPSGARAMTCDADRVHWWSTADWRPTAGPCQLVVPAPEYLRTRIRFLQEDVIVPIGDHVPGFAGPPKHNLCIAGEAQARVLRPLLSDGERVLTADDRVYALRPFRRIDLPPGRRYPDEFRRLAVRGRFLQAGVPGADDRLIDLAVEKPFPVVGGPLEVCPAAGCSFAGSHSTELVVLPAPDLELDADALALWARVVVRGELDEATGLFVKHDEETWKRNREELLRRPKPPGEFPFPGAFAEDKLYWLRKELDSTLVQDQRPLHDRLVAEEPTWENYARRAEHFLAVGDFPAAIRDARKVREFGEYLSTLPGDRAAEQIAFRPGLPKEQYELALAWLAGYGFAESVNERGALLSHLGRYAEARAVLHEPEARAAATACAALVNPAAVLRARDINADDFLRSVLIGLCELRLGRPDVARAYLARARAENGRRRVLSSPDWDGYEGSALEFLKTAAATIGGKK